MTDSSGAAVAGAKIRVFSPGIGLSRSVATNEQGEYDVGSGNPYLGGGGPRSVQLAVHFTF